MMLVHYPSKKALKENLGKPLLYTETSGFGAEFKSDGSFCVAHRPAIQGGPGREFFAEVTMKGGLIAAVR
jgi:hypothetical protein